MGKEAVERELDEGFESEKSSDEAGVGIVKVKSVQTLNRNTVPTYLVWIHPLASIEEREVKEYSDTKKMFLLMLEIWGFHKPVSGSELGRNIGGERNVSYAQLSAAR